MSTLKLELGAVGRIAGRRPSVFVCHPMKSAGTRCISRRQVGLLGRRLNRTDSVGAAVRGVLQVHSGSHRIRPGRGGPVSARGQELPTLASGRTLSVLSDPPDERDMPTLATTSARLGRTNDPSKLELPCNAQLALGGHGSCASTARPRPQKRWRKGPRVAAYDLRKETIDTGSVTPPAIRGGPIEQSLPTSLHFSGAISDFRT